MDDRDEQNEDFDEIQQEIRAELDQDWSEVSLQPDNGDEMLEDLDESQRAEVLEAESRGPSDGVVITDLRTDRERGTIDDDDGDIIG